MKTKIGVSVFLLSFMFVLSAFQNDPWIVPDKYKEMTNPVKADGESLKYGKVLYDQHCKSCHGKEGYGDGPKAAQLETPSGDFTLEEFQAQPDGALFYKTIEGREDMPSFRKKIPDDEDVWNVVNYIRTLKE
jgi:mono/diheme cytochrome c family protein